ncbi:MAG TPA: Rid family hydrolase [Caulobacteraceae bacterium]|nr:Rid family hydrolase [Caulobacteraceae bacterium]
MIVQHTDHAEVFVSGCTGFDYSTMTGAEDVAVQARQGFANIADALTQAGGDLTDPVRVRYYRPDSGDWLRVTPVFGECSPTTATCLICGRSDPGIWIEIEADARFPRQSLVCRRGPDDLARRLRDAPADPGRQRCLS